MIIPRTRFYNFVKYRIYKPIRTIAEGFRYAYYFSDETQLKQRKQFIKKIKER